MKITVTQEDIDKGQRLNGQLCPVGRAATRAFGKPMYATKKRLASVQIVCGLRLKGYFLERLDKLYITLPEQAVNFIDVFDSRGVVEPFEFEVPDEAWSSRAIRI